MMTHKDYVETARILASVADAIPAVVHARLVREFATIFERDNPNFKRDRFINACSNACYDV